MIKLAVSGASGRMGKAIITKLSEQKDMCLVAALEHPSHPHLGKDSGIVAGIGDNHIEITDSFDSDISFDVLIEFTRPAATLRHLETCLRRDANMVIGTTGLSAGDYSIIKKAAEKIAIMQASNTSVGINLCLGLVALATKTIGKDVDIEIIEAHHKHKEDAPSGTALSIGQTIADALEVDLAEQGVFQRHGDIGPRVDGSIGFSTVRGGNIAGEHTVMFISDNERIEITHRATDRMIFAGGAIRAARWLQTKNSGMHSMNDVLGLD